MIFLALKLNGEIIRLSADRVGGIDRSGRINEKAGARKLAVFVDGVNLDDRPAAAFEDGLDLAADRAGRVILGAGDRDEQTNDRGEDGERPAKGGRAGSGC